MRKTQIGPCSAEGCERPSRCRFYCKSHYSRLQAWGEVRPELPIKPKAIAGMGHVDPKRGYRQFGTANGTRREHRLVMEAKIGRKLLPGENIHHINGVRDDNRPENLELWVTSQPAGQRVEDKVAWATETLQRYAPHVLATT